MLAFNSVFHWSKVCEHLTSVVLSSLGGERAYFTLCSLGGAVVWVLVFPFSFSEWLRPRNHCQSSEGGSHIGQLTFSVSR